MANLGARSVITLSRSGLDSPKALSLVDEMKCRGVVLTVLKGDAADSEGLRSALNGIEGKVPPIRGVIQAAMVIQVRAAFFRNLL
jgi:hypothetical protein